MKRIIGLMIVAFLYLPVEYVEAKEWIVNSTQPKNLEAMIVRQIEGTDLYLIDTSLPKQQLQEIRGVEYVEENVSIDLPLIPAINHRTTLLSSLSHLNNFPSGLERVKVAVLDTGVNIADLTLTPYLEEGFSVVPSEDINDVNGHGTEMTHILTEGAPTNLRVVPIKIMNRFGRSSVYTVVDGLYKAKDLNVSIVNLSFGAVMGSETLHAAVQELHKSGITLVSAVGNLGGIDAFYPARYDEVIGVGAHDENYKIAPFSQIGVGVDLFVRGTEIRTKSLNNEWVTKNGTSHASAYLAKQLAYYETMSIVKKEDWKLWLQSFLNEQRILDLMSAHFAILQDLKLNYTEWPAVEKEEDEPIYVSFSNSVFEQSLHLGAIFAIANDELLPIEFEREEDRLVIKPKEHWVDGTQIYFTTTLQSTLNQKLKEALTFTVNLN